MTNSDVSIALTKEQIARVVRGAGESGHLSALLARLDEADDLSGLARALIEDDRFSPSERFSRSLLRALLVLSEFPLDGTEREVTDVAKRVGIGPSTAYRYAATWVEIGVLEQNPATRKYRRAVTR